MKKDKLIVSDLDGTLLNKESKCSENTKDYLRNLKNNGYTIAIATGRILSSALDGCDGADFADYVICDTGALIYDVSKKEIIFQSVIDKEYINYVCEAENSDFTQIAVCNTQNIHKYTKLQNPRRYIFDNIVSDKNELLEKADNITHMTIGAINNKKVMELADKFRKDFNDLRISIMQDSFGDEQWIEIYNKDISKYSSINKVANINNISNDNIIAFGDGLNDIDMLEKCGVGVAMQNALDIVKSSAKYIAGYHHEDGVIKFLDNYLKEN